MINLYLTNIDEFNKKDSSLLAAFQSVRLGATTNPFDTNSFTAVQALPRELLQDFTAPTGSYSSYGFDINPFDIAYRADTKTDYYVDYGSLLARVAFTASTGGAIGATKAGWTALLALIN